MPPHVARRPMVPHRVTPRTPHLHSGDARPRLRSSPGDPHDRDVVDRRLAGLGIGRAVPPDPGGRDPMDGRGPVAGHRAGEVVDGPTDRSGPRRSRSRRWTRRSPRDGSCGRTSCARRGTSSLPDDIRWLIELTGPRIQALSAYMHADDRPDRVHPRTVERDRRASTRRRTVAHPRGAAARSWTRPGSRPTGSASAT